ncbi:hypothetical protein [Anabaena azotica]|uniref:Transposase n=1 Tax=Anabaena azotica FACHB-119 TaxID=947527 RepID=A0ABR8D4A0_9NOST|nr:hypothetical protein [Anabaena azotica]MBD2501732.1 hypothetical protein [Anabaena azotica FACHB-119]
MYIDITKVQALWLYQYWEIELISRSILAIASDCLRNICNIAKYTINHFSY